jgi:hypothetical protein
MRAGRRDRIVPSQSNFKISRIVLFHASTMGSMKITRTATVCS